MLLDYNTQQMAQTSMQCANFNRIVQMFSYFALIGLQFSNLEGKRTVIRIKYGMLQI